MLTNLARSLDSITDPKLVRVHDYWQQARAGKPMPARNDIDPLDLRYCLGWVCLVDVVREPDRHRFRFRLDGSHIAHLTGMDLTGRHADELEDPPYRDLVTAVYDRVVATKAPVFIANIAHWRDRGYRVEQVAMPLSNDGETVTGLMDVTLPVLLPHSGATPN
ncbi:MAG: PAS domain-containing protein [Dongiaceae bacterium]